MIAGGIFAAAASAALIATLTPASEVRVERGTVRVGNIARVQGRAAEAVRDVVIASLPAHGQHRLPRTQLAGLLRRAVPGISIVGDLTGEISLVRPPEIPAQSSVADRAYSDEPAIRRGAKLALVTRERAVTITREVTALQTTQRNQQRLFVEAEGGEVFSVRIKKDSEQ